MERIGIIHKRRSHTGKKVYKMWTWGKNYLSYSGHTQTVPFILTFVTI